VYDNFVYSGVVVPQVLRYTKISKMSSEETFWYHFLSNAMSLVFGTTRWPSV
jgi:hypothetical protein